MGCRIIEFICDSLQKQPKKIAEKKCSVLDTPKGIKLRLG